MNKPVCPSCENDLKKEGFYIKQSVYYSWSEKEQRFIIDSIYPEETLSTCCCGVLDDDVADVQSLEEFLSNK